MFVSRSLLSCLVFLSCAFTAFSEELIRFEKIKLEDQFYGEGAAIGDINKDGKNDIVYGPYWWEGPDFKTQHAYYEPKAFNINGYSDNFFDYTFDFNGDGFPDILVLGFPGKEARLYLNPGKDVASDNPWKMFVDADVVDNESPEFTDLTGDGKAEIVCSKGGLFGYFEPDWQDVTKLWTWHPLTENVGVAKFTHGMGVGDVNGDGKPDLLEAKRWWEQPKETQDDKTKDTRWVSHPFQLTGSGGAQMYAYDFNGDGRNDIASSLNAHQFGVGWFEQGSADTPVRNEKPQSGAAGKKDGVDLMTAKSVTTVNGGGKQQVQVIREFTYPTDFDPPTTTLSKEQLEELTKKKRIDPSPPPTVTTNTSGNERVVEVREIIPPTEFDPPVRGGRQCGTGFDGIESGQSRLPPRQCARSQRGDWQGLPA